MLNRKMLLIPVALVLSATASADEWGIYSDNESPQPTQECYVGTRPGTYYQFLIAKHATEVAACKDAKNRKVDPTHQEFGKCPSYTTDTVANCKKVGVQL